MWVNNDIQHGWLRRRGFRGRRITVYLHRYGGVVEKTERMHAHPWRKAWSFLIFGTMDEERQTRDGAELIAELRTGPSFRRYALGDRHRIDKGEGWSLFIGWGRLRYWSSHHTCLTPQGYAHYSELTSDEVGFMGDVVTDMRRTASGGFREFMRMFGWPLLGLAVIGLIVLTVGDWPLNGC